MVPAAVVVLQDIPLTANGKARQTWLTGTGILRADITGSDEHGRANPIRHLRPGLGSRAGRVDDGSSTWRDSILSMQVVAAPRAGIVCARVMFRRTDVVRLAQVATVMADGEDGMADDEVPGRGALRSCCGSRALAARSRSSTRRCGAGACRVTQPTTDRAAGLVDRMPCCGCASTTTRRAGCWVPRRDDRRR